VLWKTIKIFEFTYRFSYSFFNLFKISNFLNFSSYLLDRKKERRYGNTSYQHKICLETKEAFWSLGIYKYIKASSAWK